MPIRTSRSCVAASTSSSKLQTACIDELEQAADSWKLDPDTLALQSAREQELGRHIEALARRQEGREKDLAYLGKNERVDEVDGEIAVLESELADGLRERDRLWVVAAVLREAERRFREEHQPEILQQAGCYLAAITGGRYERILIDDAVEGQFLLRGRGRSRRRLNGCP